MKIFIIRRRAISGINALNSDPSQQGVKATLKGLISSPQSPPFCGQNILAKIVDFFGLEKITLKNLRFP
jgi:hypothetical protein